MHRKQQELSATTPLANDRKGTSLEAPPERLEKSESGGGGFKIRRALQSSTLSDFWRNFLALLIEI